jgi:hypothetical protein
MDKIPTQQHEAIDAWRKGVAEHRSCTVNLSLPQSTADTATLKKHCKYGAINQEKGVSAAENVPTHANVERPSARTPSSLCSKHDNPRSFSLAQTSQSTTVFLNIYISLIHFLSAWLPWKTFPAGTLALNPGQSRLRVQ